MIDKAVAGTSVYSAIKVYSRRKDFHAAFLLLIANHAGYTKNRSVVKSICWYLFWFTSFHILEIKLKINKSNMAMETVLFFSCPHK